ncbi:MAG: flavodoxin domain-containing protein [Lachnospiraceae bacterium]|nr:flavodoxin domain-containing protein [Lachnospiraceae bacterium]MDD3660254.1 flavodoxin domain-containing protein [Lachnospiraceae bacterium]
MEIGIIVYSQTGNTMSVAQKLQQSLSGNGHHASIQRVEVISEKEPLKLKTVPDVSSFDVIVFASPVQAFSLAPSMKQYLTQISELNDKKVFCFVTQHLKKAWMGGNHALSQMQTACKMKSGLVSWSGGVNWSSDKREQQINEIVDTITRMI